jgi:hypothetical protein
LPIILGDGEMTSKEEMKRKKAESKYLISETISQYNKVQLFVAAACENYKSFMTKAVIWET